MALPGNLDGGGQRAIVIEDVPPGTGIGDLVGAFSPFGTIQFASVGPPAVVGFESEEAAARAVLVASMKIVNLAVVKVTDTRPKTKTSPISAAAMFPVAAISTMDETAAAPSTEAKSSPGKAASAPAVHMDRPETIDALRDSMVALEKSLDTLNRKLNRLLAEQSCKREEEEEDAGGDIDVYDYDKAWTDGYKLAFNYWPDDNYSDAWFAGYDAGVEDSPVSLEFAKFNAASRSRRCGNKD